MDGARGPVDRAAVLGRGCPRAQADLTGVIDIFTTYPDQAAITSTDPMAQARRFSSGAEANWEPGTCSFWLACVAA
jgi:hypothetical protein